MIQTTIRLPEKLYKELKEEAEILIAINAVDIERVDI